MFFLELSFGQFASLGPISVWKAVPIFKGNTYINEPSYVYKSGISSRNKIPVVCMNISNTILEHLLL